MKKTLILFLLISISGYVSCQTKTPKIFIPVEAYDFGQINQGQKVTHEFVVKNIGEDTLSIFTVKASCGCTAAQPQDKELLPGDSTIISVTFNSEGRRGGQKKHVYISTNDPEKPESRVSISCNVIPSTEDIKEVKTPKLSLSKKEFDFGDVAKGKIVEGSIKFVNIGDAVLKIKDIISSCDCAIVSSDSKSIEPGMSGSLLIKFNTADRTLGKMTRTVTVYSNDPNFPEQTIVLRINVLLGNS